MLKKTKLISLILLSGAFVVPAGASAETAPFKQETNISQQNGKVTCIVEDSFGPVIGASVVIKGTTNGNVTDMDGNFSIKSDQKNPILRVSYIGYDAVETSVKGNKSVRIVLKENTKALDEVVVVGYGTMRRSDVTGSISSVKGSELVKNSTSNVVQSLAGKMSGGSKFRSSRWRCFYFDSRCRYD